MSTQVSHDAFGRFSIRRSKFLHYGTSICAWCGNYGKESVKGGAFKLYRYAYQSDGFGARPIEDTKLFCCKSCRDSYYS